MAEFKEGQCMYQDFPVIVQFAMFIHYDYDKENLIQSRSFRL